MKSKKRRKLLKRIFLLYVPLVIMIIIILAPLYWMLITSFKESTEIFAKPLTYWPHKFIVDNFVKLFSKSGFGRYFINSAISASLITVFVTILALIGGYAMSRYDFKGKGFVYVLLLMTQMFPAIVLLIPLFRMMIWLKLIDNLLSVIVVGTVTNLPFCMFLMMGFYGSIPKTLEEAAQVDGCSLLGAVFRVLLPNMRSSMVATGAYAFINAWNLFLYAMAFITNRNNYTLPLILSEYKSEFGVDYGGLAAACVICLVPVLIIFVFIQKNLVGDATSGSVKG